MDLRHDHTQRVNEYVDAALAKILKNGCKVAIGNESEIQFRVLEESSDNEGWQARRTGPVQLARLSAGRLNQAVERTDRFLFGDRNCKDNVGGRGDRDQFTDRIIG